MKKLIILSGCVLIFSGCMPSYDMFKINYVENVRPIGAKVVSIADTAKAADKALGAYDYLKDSNATVTEKLISIDSAFQDYDKSRK